MSAGILINTASKGFTKFFQTNAAPQASAYPAIAPTVTQIGKTAGVLKMDDGGQSNCSYLKLVFWAVGTAGSTFNVKLVGWRQVGVDGEFFPEPLVDITCTIGSATRAVVSPTENMASGISVNSGIIIDAASIGPADSVINIQYLKLDLCGCQYVQMVPGTKTGTCSAVNGGSAGF